MIIADSPSPNFGPRAEGKKIKYLVLHYTDTQSAFDALKLLQDPARQVSSHYLVDEDGTALRLVPEEMRAWHAGKSWWEGETDINSCSIGIEIQNPGHQFGYRHFPAEQVKAVAELCRDIIARHKILPYHVVAHSDIAPGRKQDPGELFPWEQLAQDGVGLWPKVTEKDEADVEDLFERGAGAVWEFVQPLLTYFGYDPRVDMKTLVTSFQLHFEQDVFAFPEKTGVLSHTTAAKAVALHRQKLMLRPKA